MHFLRVLLF